MLLSWYGKQILSLHYSLRISSGFDSKAKEEDECDAMFKMYSHVEWKGLANVSFGATSMATFPLLFVFLDDDSALAHSSRRTRTALPRLQPMQRGQQPWLLLR